jgi:hypothetical protein
VGQASECAADLGSFTHGRAPPNTQTTTANGGSSRSSSSSSFESAAMSRESLPSKALLPVTLHPVVPKAYHAPHLGSCQLGIIRGAPCGCRISGSSCQPCNCLVVLAQSHHLYADATYAPICTLVEKRPRGSIAGSRGHTSYILTPRMLRPPTCFALILLLLVFNRLQL